MQRSASFASRLRRDRAAADLAKALYWRDYKLEHGPAAGVRVADELRKQVVAQRGDWPSPRERAEDSRAHLEAIDAFAKVARLTRYIGGHEVPLITVEDLIASKILAGRRKDIEDARGILLEQWEAIDLDRVDEVLSALEDALEDPRLKPRLARLVRQVRKMLAPASPRRR